MPSSSTGHRERCPPRSSADPFVLQHAVSEHALIVSNDRFWDHEARRRGVLTVQFVLQGAEFRPYEEATWFDPAGGAVRIALRELQRPLRA